MLAIVVLELPRKLQERTKATPSGIPVSGQGFPQDRMRAGGFCHYCIMHIDSCYTLNHKVQATIPQWGRMGMRYTNTIIMA